MEDSTKKEQQKSESKISQNWKSKERKGDILYLKWTGYNNSFNCWINKKDMVQTSEYFPKPNYLGENLKVE